MTMADANLAVQAAEPLLLRVEEAARLLSISRSMAWELVARGDLTSVKINNSRRIPRRELEAYVARLAR